MDKILNETSPEERSKLFIKELQKLEEKYKVWLEPHPKGESIEVWANGEDGKVFIDYFF